MNGSVQRSYRAISTGYWVLGIVCLDQLKGARHTDISYHDIWLGLGTKHPGLLAAHKMASPRCYLAQVSAGKNS